MSKSEIPEIVLKTIIERSLFERSVYDKSVEETKLSPKILAEKSVHQNSWQEKITLLRSPRNWVAGNVEPEKSALISCGKIDLTTEAIINFVFSTFELEKSKLNKRVCDKSAFSKFALLMHSYLLDISSSRWESYS